MERPERRRCQYQEEKGCKVCYDSGDCTTETHNQSCDDWEAYYEPIVRTLKEELEFLKMQVKKSDKDIETKVVERLTKSYILRELKAELQTLKATELSEGEIEILIHAPNKEKIDLYLAKSIAKAIITARDKKRG